MSLSLLTQAARPGLCKEDQGNGTSSRDRQNIASRPGLRPSQNCNDRLLSKPDRLDCTLPTRGTDSRSLRSKTRRHVTISPLFGNLSIGGQPQHARLQESFISGPIRPIWHRQGGPASAVRFRSPMSLEATGALTATAGAEDICRVSWERHNHGCYARGSNLGLSVHSGTRAGVRAGNRGCAGLSRFSVAATLHARVAGIFGGIGLGTTFPIGIATGASLVQEIASLGAPRRSIVASFSRAGRSACSILAF
jgi:hypothetical protein